MCFGGVVESGGESGRKAISLPATVREIRRRMTILCNMENIVMSVEQSHSHS